MYVYISKDMDMQPSGHPAHAQESATKALERTPLEPRT